MKLLLSFFLAVSAVLRAQEPATFEVASVKLNKSGTLRANVGMLPNGVNIVNIPLRAIIQLAYGVNQPWKVIGLPDWAATERYDISAKAAGAINLDQRRLMMQALLADRFKLNAKMEKREMPVIALMLNRADGKLGPNLVETKGCLDQREAAARRKESPDDKFIVCGPQTGGDGRLILLGTTVEQFSAIVALIVQRTVSDKTGLTGRYDLDLTFSPERALPVAGGDTPPVVNPNAPSIYTAVREQLGLRLENQKDFEEVLVVSHLERPTEN
jgi:uncharacterized protein (TIGR03435 family)